MILSTLAANVGNLFNDQFTLKDGNKVTISCANRSPSSVTGVLAEPLSFSASATYQTYDQALNNTLSAVTGVIDAGVNLLTGGTVQQPWFKRQYWTSTDPLSFSVKIAFIAQTDAYSEVFEPCQTLIGYLYPRKMVGGNALALYAPPGPNLFTGSSEQNRTTKAGGLIDSAVNKGKNFVNSLVGFNDGQGSGPDPAGITVGKLISLKYCYLQSVNIEFSKALDSNGYPHYATATCQVQAFDVSAADTKGVFSLSQTQVVDLSVGSIIDDVSSVLP